METEKSLEALERINLALQSIGEKLKEIIELQKVLVERSEIGKEKADLKTLPLDVDTLLSLPDHLRKTAYALCSLDHATADAVAAETGRTRAAESDYLNQLEGMGYLKKERKGRTVYFYVKK